MQSKKGSCQIQKSYLLQSSVLHKMPSERTFSTYTKQQAHSYAALRGEYSSSLYNTICEHHASTGGQFTTLLDVGCGPGNSTRPLAKRFEHAVGVDVGEKMIEVAREIGGRTAEGRSIAYELMKEGEFGERFVEKGAVDLIVAGMAVSARIS